MPIRPLDVLAPSSYAELESLLQGHISEFSKSNRRLAELILADPAGFAFKTIGEAATDVGVNQSTVNRFATSIGLDGYPALTALCKQRLRDRALLVDRFERLPQSGEASEGSLRETASLDAQNITRTLAAIDEVKWRLAATKLAHAREIHVMGLRKVYSMASLLAYLLNLVREDVRVLDLSAGLLTDNLRGLTTRDVFVGMSLKPYTSITIRAAEYAHSRKVTTIAITDTPASPLAACSDIAFFVDTASGSLLESVTACTALIQALATEVAIQSGAQSRTALRIADELLDRFKTYGNDE